MRMKKYLYYMAAVLAVWAVAVHAQGGLDQRVAELSQQIAKEMTEYQKTTIAVVQFTDLDGNVTDFGKYLAEELITRLFQTKKFKVIERQLLNKIISEQKLSLTGMVDPTSAKQLGKVLGVDAVASGTITDLAQSLRVNARLISTETGEIFAVASTEVFKDESVMKLMAAGTTVSMPPGEKPTTTPKAPAMVTTAKAVETEGFLFKVINCRRTAGKLICTIQFVNNGTDERNIHIYGTWGNPTYFYDNFGNQYPVASVLIGKKSSQAYVAEKFLPQVPVNVSFTAEDVSPEASSITIAIGTADGFKKSVVIKDIPITR